MQVNKSAARIARALAKANETYADLAPIVRELRGKGLSQMAIADELNKQGYTTRRGKPWNQVQVMRVLNRFDQ
jgi:hypothetical protein